jgi:hypothetical protein
MTKLLAITDENSTTLKLEATRPSIWAIIPGFVIFVVGAAILYPEIRISLATKTEPHIWHLLLAGGVCVLGVMVPFYRQIAPGMRQLSVFIAPYVPRLGGSRPGDPQPDGSVNPPNPPAPPSGGGQP